MKQFLILMVISVMMLLTACSKVPAGNVGVKFNLYGGDKGVQLQTLSPGRYWIGWNEELYTFPTFTQTHTWSAPADRDGKDESITFGSVEGLNINADVGLTYHIDGDKVTKLFQTYRKGVDEITDVYLRNMVRDSLVKEASSAGIEQIYGVGKADLINRVQIDVQKQVAGIGIVVEKVYWVGNLRLPDSVTASINSKIQATQMAEQRKNEVAQAQAEAQKEVAVAEGQAAAKLALAEADAKAISLRGEAVRNNPGVAQLNWIEKWDGKMPNTVVGDQAKSLLQISGQQ